MKRNLLTCSFAAMLLATPAMAQHRIDQIAPARSFVVAGLDNPRATMDGLQRTRLWELWQHPDIQGLAAEMLTEFSEGIEEMFRELDVNLDSMPLPAGPSGIAVFMVMDQDMGISTPGVLVNMDFGDEADDMQTLLDAIMAKIREEGGTVEEQQILGRTVFSITGPEPEVADDDPDDWDDWDDFDFDPLGGMFDGAFDSFSTMHLTRVGTSFVMTNLVDTLVDTLQRIDGIAGPVIGDDVMFQRSIDQIGGRGDGYVVLMMPELREMLRNAPDLMMFMPMAAGPIEALGLGNVDAFSMSVTIDGLSMVDQKLGILINGEKKGLMRLLAVEGPKGQLPGFVSPETSSYGRLNFNFRGLMEVVNDVIRSLPEEVRFEAEQMMVEVGPMIEQGLNALGPDIHIIETIRQPMTAESKSMLVAINSPRPDDLHGLIGMMAPGMGLEQREFLGQAIFSDPNGWFDIAIGLGGGFVVIGQERAVEQALRTTGQAGLPSLADERPYQRILAALPAGNVTAWNFTNTIAVIEHMMAEMANPAWQMGAFFDDLPENVRQDMLENMQGIDPNTLPDIELLRQYFGPSGWQMISTADGFVMTTYFFGPTE